VANSNNASMWAPDRDFADAKTGIVVRVSKKQTFRPVYSIQISKTREDGKLVASIPVFISAGKNDPDCVSVVSRLMALAVMHVETETRLKDDEIAAAKAARTGKKQMGVG